MRICLLGLENLAVLAPEFRHHNIAGEGVQQTLLARALVRRGHDVRMVTWDHGQPEAKEWDGIRVHKAYAPSAGVPLLRFFHPRWSRLWRALERADADLYYTSCAGMHVGLLALFCRRHGKRFVFRSASDADCDPARLLVRYRRDRWLYGYGLRRAGAILVQSEAQRQALARHYGLAGRVAGMLVEPAQPGRVRDVEILWVSNIRRVKRPDRVLDLAAGLLRRHFHMVGGPLPGEEALYREIEAAARSRLNVTFHGRLSYHDTAALYGRARVFLNTSDVEGFPNSYLQAWMRGVPVVTRLDPDRVIEREGLGAVARSSAGLEAALRGLLGDAQAWQAASARCVAHMAREHGEERVLGPYLEAFDTALRRPPAAEYGTARA
ncbi:MAG TPA: glycosyltransferase family 4 protein [Burkholderiales bacterium]|nr:glycosyltransferase family 4 protein [Burkholderiales bacterium]